MIIIIMIASVMEGTRPYMANCFNRLYALIYRVIRLVLSCHLKGRKIKDTFIGKIHGKNNTFNVYFIICV